jgi:exonuclease III
MKFGTWNVRSLYRSGSLKRVSRELAKYKLDLVGVQEVRWDKCATEPAGDYTFFYVNANADHHLGTGFFVHNSLHETSNDNGARVVNFATSKNLVVKSTMFPHRKIRKYTWTSPDGKKQSD